MIIAACFSALAFAILVVAAIHPIINQDNHDAP